MELLMVGMGGILGTFGRYMVGLAVGQRYIKAFPLGTFLINMTGAFVLGFSVAHTLGLPPQQIGIERYGFQIGFIGAYTTHSTFAYESIRLVEEGDWKEFVLYVLGSTALGVLSCGAGYYLGS